MSVPSNLVPVSISNLPVANTPQGTDLTIIVQNGVTKRTNIAALVGTVQVPSTRLINSGTGLAGGGGLSQDRTLYIANTGVSAGTYGSSTQVPILTINPQGQITAVSTSSFSVDFASITGKPTTLAGYGITDAQPLNYNLSGISPLGTTGFLARTGSGTFATRTITAGAGLSISDGDGVANNPVVSLSDTSVSAGSYGSATQIPVFTVNSRGQITSAGETSITPAWSSITGTPTTLAGYGITDAVPNSRTVTGTYSIVGGGPLSSNITLSLTNDSNAPGSNKYYGTDGSGAKGWYTLVAGGTVTSITAGTGLSGGTITVSGTIAIADTGVLAASYGSASSVSVISVNAQGQITSATNTSIAISASQITSGTLSVVNGGTGASTAAGARTNLDVDQAGTGLVYSVAMG